MSTCSCFSLRAFMSSLLVSTALTSASYAQTAQTPPDQTPPAAQPAPAPRPAAAPANNAGQQNFGTVYATEPAPQRSFAQTGLTSSPTDYGAVLQRAAARTTAQGTGRDANAPSAPVNGNSPDTPVTPGGVTRKDIGGGYMILEQATKTRSTVTRDAIDKQSVTANPYQLINLLPGVIQSSPDNTGLVGGNIRLRGFNSDHIGLTIEGMPVNDSGNYALFPQEYVDAENIGQISIAQGVPDLDSPHVGSTGGVINIFMRDPAKIAGGYADYSVGSNGLNREFIRLESGEINGVSAYVSYSNLQDDHWIGPGKDRREHIDFKAKIELSPGNTIRFAAIYNDATNGNYASIRKSEVGTPYQTWNNRVEPALPASFFATGSAIAGIDQFAGNANAYTAYRINPFRNLILSAPSNFTLSSNLKFDTIPYYWYGFGNGGGVGQFTEQGGPKNSNGAPTGFYFGNLLVTGVDVNANGRTNDRINFYNPSVTETDRPGIINKFTYTVGSNEIVFGNWFEYAFHKQTAPFVPLNADGSVQDVFAEQNNFRLPAGAVCQVYDPVAKKAGATVACPTSPLQRRNTSTETMTNAIFIGDTWHVNPRLDIIGGVKQIFVDRSVENNLPGLGGTSLHDDATLPTIGARYKIDKQNTVFANYATSFRSAPNFTLSDSVNTGNGSRTPIAPIKPERGNQFEIGHRYQGSLIATSVSGFLGIYDNFQQSTNIADPSNPAATINVTRNIGGLLNYGVNAEIGTAPIYNFRPYVSGELLHTELLDNLRSDVTVGGVAVREFAPTKGKDLPGAPNYSFAVGIDYDNGHWFGNLAFKYIGEQYSTYLNDEKIDAFGRVDAAIGYRFSDIGYLKQPEIKLQLFNILNSTDLTGVNSITTNATAVKGVNGNTINGSIPNYYLGQDFSMLATFKTGF